jgi:bacterioferritin
MDRSAWVDKLNEIPRWKYAGLVQYTQFRFVVRGPLREVSYKFFREDGEEELGHAHKVVALGGDTTVERAVIKPSLDLTEMLE